MNAREVAERIWQQALEGTPARWTRFDDAVAEQEAPELEPLDEGQIQDAENNYEAYLGRWFGEAS